MEARIMTRKEARKRASGTHLETLVPTTEALPPISPVVIDAVTEMLMTDHTMKRPPEKSAALLALIVELYRADKPFPTRQLAADAIGSSVYTVDSALSTRIDEGYLTEVVETTTGKVSARHSAVRRRYYIPSERLLQVAEKARRKR